MEHLLGIRIITNYKPTNYFYLILITCRNVSLVRVLTLLVTCFSNKGQDLKKGRGQGAFLQSKG